MLFKGSSSKKSAQLIVLLFIFALLSYLLFIIFQHQNLLANAQKKSPTLISAKPKFEKVITTPKPTPPQPSKKLEEIVKTTLVGRNEEFGIVVKNLNTGEYYTLNPDEKFTAASLYKISVMYTIFKLAHLGKLDIHNQTIQSNLKSMITVSSNESALYLVHTYTSFLEVTNDAHDLGMKDTDYTSTPLITTPTDIAKLLEIITAGKAISLDDSVAMLDLMDKQQRTDRIPAKLPDEAIVANKTGELDDFLHDAAVIGGPKNTYILVIMTKHALIPESVKPTFADLSLKIYNYFENEATASASNKN